MLHCNFFIISHFIFSCMFSLPYGAKPTYSEYVKGSDKRNFPGGTKHRGASTSKKDVAKKFSHRKLNLYFYM